jgi:hypothetical protein
MKSQVAVTVYNDDLALVRESRELELKKGEQNYAFSGVAAKIDPTSVHFRAISDPAAINLLEQNFEYDLVGTERLLQKYIDEEIIATTEGGAVFAGKLLSALGGDVVLKDQEGRVQAVKASALHSIQFPALPEGLFTRPTLIWRLQCNKAGKHQAEISYLTGGLSWHAEYVAVTNEKDSGLELSGWVSMANNSGATYEEATLKLVAGDVHRAETPRPVRAMFKAEMAMAAAPQFEEKEFFEYHLYTLQRPATLKDRQTKQLSLFPAAQVPVQKLYIYDPMQDDKKIQVKLQFRNDKEHGLGMALPKGKIRVYKRDRDGAQEFIGEDLINHTPKDEVLRVLLCNAFDIVGERIVKDVRYISDKARQETVFIQIRNHKEEAIEVTVLERFYGDWQLTGKAPHFIKKDAYTAEFPLQVPARGEASFTYTVLYK